MKANSTLLSGKAGLCLMCAFSLVTLSSCDTYVGAGVGGGYGGYGPGYGAYAPAYGRSNYTYYPRYSTYYHPQTRMYHYHNGSSWVSSPHPYGVHHNVIRSSPSVPLHLNSHPQYHHSGVGHAYPQHWNGHGNGHHH